MTDPTAIDWTKALRTVADRGRLDRRGFLKAAAALTAVPWIGLRSEASPIRKPRFRDNPFTLGVASGDPDAHGMVLWTRLAPEPLTPAGGMSPEAVEVTWQVARDERMGDIVQEGTAIATPQLGHSVHVEVDGLAPGQWFYYRFRAGDAESPVGRTRTMPRRLDMAEELRFAFASCQHYESGYFTAYEHMVQDDLDLVFHLGDYIYEYEGRDGRVRKHVGPEITTLDDYRIRLAQYRLDPALAGMHAVCPWLVTWDDHEFDNNYADLVSEEEGIDPLAFLARRANSYQAYYEMMPLRRRSVPRGPDMTLYRTCTFGRLASFQVLDTRQYRTDQPNGDTASPLNEDALTPGNTMLGRRQRGWLQARLLESTSTWNVLAQQVMMGMVGRAVDEQGVPQYSMDQWPGYAAERMDLMAWIRDRQVLNPVVITGDIHSNWVNNLRVDDREDDQPVVAAEFVTTSITSGGNGRASYPGVDRLLAANPCVQYFNAQRGYVRCTVTPSAWRSDYRIVADVENPGGSCETKASFVVEAGRPGAQTI